MINRTTSSSERPLESRPLSLPNARLEHAPDVKSPDTSDHVAFVFALGAELINEYSNQAF
jgi:hypothetical protein